MTFAVVPACGLSKRMGEPKLTLPLGRRTVIEHVIETLLTAGIDVVLVVTGPHVPLLSKLAEQAGAKVLELPQSTPDMRSTVEAGHAYLQERFNPDPHDPWLLIPADHPGFKVSTVCQLLEGVKNNLPKSIAVPTFQAQRGHPIVMQWSHAKRIQGMPSNQGINTYIRLHVDDILEVAVADAGIHININTPDDFVSISAEINALDRRFA